MSQEFIGRDLNELLKHRAKEQNTQNVTCTGLITSVDEKTYMAKAVIMPEGIETGWLPIGTIAAGNGWGFFHLPLDNTECTIDFQDGSIDNGRIRHVYSNQLDAPPPGLKQGEYLLQHKSGSLLHFDNDGNVNLVTQKDLTATVVGKVTLTAQGDVNAVVAGDVTAGVQGDVLVSAMGNLTAAALGDMTCAATGVANFGGTVCNLQGVTAVNIISAADVTITSVGALTATAASLTATVGGTATILGGSVILGTATTIDGVPFLAHTHSGVTTGPGISGPVVP